MSLWCIRFRLPMTSTSRAKKSTIKASQPGKRRTLPLVVSKDGQVIKIPANEIRQHCTADNSSYRHHCRWARLKAIISQIIGYLWPDPIERVGDKPCACWLPYVRTAVNRDMTKFKKFTLFARDFPELHNSPQSSNFA